MTNQTFRCGAFLLVVLAALHARAGEDVSRDGAPDPQGPIPHHHSGGCSGRLAGVDRIGRAVYIS